MKDVDVIVLGSGAAGLAAAVAAHEGGAKVALFEKGELVGGTSAWSGGQIWIPCNPHELEAGRNDSLDEAFRYLMSLSHGLISEEMARGYVEAGPEMVEFFERCTPVLFHSVPDIPDYHPEFPGGKTGGGRTLECAPFPYGELGEWKEKVQLSPYWTDYNITVGETTLGQPVPKELPAEVKERRRANDERGLGFALVGRLLRACLDRGIEPRTEHRAVELLTDSGEIVGVKFETPDGEKVVRAPNVILATGGFEWDQNFVKAFLRGPLTHPVSVPTNTGDGLKMAMRAGAMLGNMREAWWMPVIEVPTSVCAAGQQLLSYQRTMPGCIMVNREGRRFTNEAANYNAFGAAFHEQDVSHFAYRNLPCWLLFNADYYGRYPFIGGLDVTENDKTPPLWVLRADTLGELASELGMPAGALENSVDRFNGFAVEGRDPDFGRGESAHDIWWGDPTYRNDPRATLAPIGEGPYFAIEVKSGCLGTKGGPQTDPHARVLNVDGNVIPGLYAAGNVMASMMGMTYGGAGGTLGPCMVFGYRAGIDASSRQTGAEVLEAASA
jgi:succinate dehydrogenase/fumarate reductase flavoprotein subunit